MRRAGGPALRRAPGRGRPARRTAAARPRGPRTRPAHGLEVALYTEELFKTDNDEDNRAAVRAVPSDELRLVGLAVHGPRNGVDKVLKGLALHP
ncbi:MULTISPECIES: DUF2000 family protein [unclassified Streptosporangium]|uniref:DUF2000 family protein n=1 Tax=unclassified Streptosporangium TaxID=2632669 RepID=UPI003FA3D5F1